MWKRPRYLKTLSLDCAEAGEESKLADAFVDTLENSNGGQRGRRRPFPVSSVLVMKSSLIPSRQESNDKDGKNCDQMPPILKSFLESIGRFPNDATNHIDQQAEAESHSKNILAAIDDSSRSCLTKGQHLRYSTLLATKPSWKYNQQKEFRKIHSLVESEQKLYRQSLIEFWESNKERILTGFSNSSSTSSAGSKFIEYAAFPETVVAEWREKYDELQFGRCCQVISLENQGVGTRERGSRWTVDAIESQHLDHSATVNDNTMPSLPSVGSRVPVPIRRHPLLLLRDDDTALARAKEQNATMITSLEALEILMTDQSQWMLPISFRDDITIVDLPLPQPFTSPRACLTKGLDEGLAQWLEKAADMGESIYRYVLLNFPQTIAGRVPSGRTPKVRSSRILIRVPNTMTRFHAHVEYFPERDEEIPSSSERAIWILDQFLFTKSVVGRIDPTTCQVLKWEETSVAHALAGFDGNDTTTTTALSQTMDPIDYWHRLAQLLQAVPTIGNTGNFVLCLPGRGVEGLTASISVHKETRTGGTIRLQQELARAGEVFLGNDAIRRSMLDWKWKFDRVPFTYPVP